MGKASATSEGLSALRTVTEIPDAVKTVLGGGILARLDPWTFSTRLRYFGKAPLIEDGSVSSADYTRQSAGSYERNNITRSAEILNLFDAKDAHITYVFESRVAGESTPVEDILFCPVEPRQVRFRVRYNF